MMKFELSFGTNTSRLGRYAYDYTLPIGTSPIYIIVLGES